MVRKNLAAIKIKSALPPPPKTQNPPPKTRSFMEKMGFSCRKSAFFQAPIKLAQPFPVPELRTKTFTDTRIFLKWGFNRWGFKDFWGYLRKKAFFLCFLDFPGALRTLWKKAKEAEKGKKGRFRLISRKGGQTRLSPHLLHPHLRQPTKIAKSWQRGSTGVERYGCIPRSAANNFGEIPQKMGAPNRLF